MKDYVDRETVAHNVLMALNTNGEVMNAIYNTPAADVAPVKRGKWVDENCSVCGQYVYHGDANKFCPNCGADMRGDADAD